MILHRSRLLIAKMIQKILSSELEEKRKWIIFASTKTTGEGGKVRVGKSGCSVVCYYVIETTYIRHDVESYGNTNNKFKKTPVK